MRICMSCRGGPSRVAPPPPGSHPPGALCRRVYRRPGTRATCQHNNDAVINTLRLAGVPSRRLPTSDELCDGHERRVGLLLPEVLEVYGLRPARAAMAATLSWLSALLEAYGVRSACLARVAQGKALSGTPPGLWMLVRDGSALALLAHYYGGDAANDGGVDLRAVSLMPASSAERLGNLRVAAPVLSRLGVRFVVNDTALATMRDDTADPALLSADDDAALLQARRWQGGAAAASRRPVPLTSFPPPYACLPPSPHPSPPLTCRCTSSTTCSPRACRARCQWCRGDRLRRVPTRSAPGRASSGTTAALR